MKLYLAIFLEERINERRNSRTAQQDEQTQKKQYNQYRQQPPLFIVFEEEPELYEQGCSLFLCQPVEFAGLFLSRILRHLHSPILLELVEVLFVALRRLPAQPIALCSWVKLAMKRVTAH